MLIFQKQKTMFSKFTFVFMFAVAAILVACSNEPKQPEYKQPVQGITVKKSDGTAPADSTATTQPVK